MKNCQADLDLFRTPCSSIYASVFVQIVFVFDLFAALEVLAMNMAMTMTWILE